MNILTPNVTGLRHFLISYDKSSPWVCTLGYLSYPPVLSFHWGHLSHNGQYISGCFPGTIVWQVHGSDLRPLGKLSRKTGSEVRTNHRIFRSKVSCTCQLTLTLVILDPCVQSGVSSILGKEGGQWNVILSKHNKKWYTKNWEKSIYNFLKYLKWSIQRTGFLSSLFQR